MDDALWLAVAVSPRPGTTAVVAALLAAQSPLPVFVVSASNGAQAI